MTCRRPTRSERAAAGLLVLLVGATLLAGCGGSTPQEDAAAGDETPPPAGEGAAGEAEAQVAPDGEGADAEATDGETAQAEPAGDEAEQSSQAPLPRRNVQLYFPSTGGEGLVGEWHEIFATITPGDRAKQIVADLISGPGGGRALRALPRGTRLRQAYVLEDGVAYLDFSSDLADGVGGGSMSELLTVYAIVNSVVENVPEIRKVGILVNGHPIETLNGHVDLRRPLPPDYSLVIGKASALRRLAADPLHASG